MPRPADSIPPATETPGYAERLWLGPVGWTMVVLVCAAMAIAFVPVGFPVAVAAGGVLALVLIVVVLRTTVQVRVVGGELQAGRARIPVQLLGEPEALDATGRRSALGPELDARAYVLVRGWIPGAVRIAVQDDADPVPYWVISTRRPAQLAAALVEAQRAAPTAA